MYIGDSPSDGKAARQAGMRSIGVTWGANGEAALRVLFGSKCCTPSKRPLLGGPVECHARGCIQHHSGGRVPDVRAAVPRRHDHFDEMVHDVQALSSALDRLAATPPSTSFAVHGGSEL